MSAEGNASGRARVVRLLAAVAVVASMGALSRVPYGAADADDAALRLTWRFRGEEVASCRRPTAAELADLPLHMRNPDACVGDLPPFFLTVEIDGEDRVSRTVRPSGARGDRPVFVYDELALSPGAHRVVVRFGVDEPALERSEVLALDTVVTLDPAGVLLVTRASDGALEVRRPLAPEPGR